MKAIIVDDEPKAIDLIQDYVSHFPGIEVLSVFRNGLKALAYLKDNPVELIFLDINMPHLSGLSLSKITGTEVKIIFITAYAEHGAESYDVEAIDYLLKPVSFERFTKAVHKVLKYKSATPGAVTGNEWINLKSNGNIYRVPAADIYFLEKAANYMKYHCADRKHLVRQSAAEALKELPAYFLQVQKSFIVNSRKIDYYNKEEININGVRIPVGSMFRDTFIQYMQKEGL